jgi:hypothetical protein
MDKDIKRIYRRRLDLAYKVAYLAKTTVEFNFVVDCIRELKQIIKSEEV